MDGSYRQYGSNAPKHRLACICTRDPLIEYKFQGYEMFDSMTESIQANTVRALFNVQAPQQQQMTAVFKKEDMQTNLDESAIKKPVRRESAKVGRNDPCTCGSGKKYKQCCMNKG